MPGSAVWQGDMQPPMRQVLRGGADAAIARSGIRCFAVLRRESRPVDATVAPVTRTANDSPIIDRLLALLGGVEHSVTEHDPVYTSEEAAAVRGATLKSGAKALVIKAGDGFFLVVVPADRKLKSDLVRRALGAKKSRFARREKLLDLTGLEPGSVPPFGLLFGLPTVCDPALGESERINFNAGDHRCSVQMRFLDYVSIEAPRLASLT